MQVLLLLRRHLLKDIQRKDYKKNKDNPRDTPDRAIERSHGTRADKLSDSTRDLGKQHLKKLNELQAGLEKKALLLADQSDLPSKEADLLRLIDVLFDAKKLYKDLLERMERLTVPTTDSYNEQLPFESTAVKMEKEECPST